MKKTGICILIIIISIFLLGFISIYIFKNRVSSNLESKNIAVRNSWKFFNDKLCERDSLLNSQSLMKSDSLNYLLNKSRSERTNKDNSIEIVFNEYQLNKFLMENVSETDTKILELNNSLNTLKTNYNSVVKDYNLYFSIFPNFIVAKKMHIKRAKYFEIEYGKVNENPIKKSEELPDWAKNIDTT